jgi:alkylated DNA repair dioxygenase AlkB
MHPLDLFASGFTQLVADDEGGVRYWPAFAGAQEAEAWFQALYGGVEWRVASRQMYDRRVDVPRLLASCSVDALPPSLPLADMLVRVQRLVPAPYNGIGMNLYRDGSDSVAMHNDKLHTILPGQPIALVSLGDPRRMNIRAKAGDRRSLSIELEPGSLLVMSHASQITHEHGVPKTTRRVSARMSVVFRVRPAGWAAEY